jgi:hypothetical protein
MKAKKSRELHPAWKSMFVLRVVQPQKMARQRMCETGNMLTLWIFGDNVEDRFGHLKFIIFYLLCGLAATFAQLAFSLGSNIPNLVEHLEPSPVCWMLTFCCSRREKSGFCRVNKWFKYLR